MRILIPKRLMKVIPGQTMLDLTPEIVKFLDAYKIGKKFGHSWSIPTGALRPSDVTWYFEYEKPVLGLNYQDATWVVSSSLALAEVEWLVQEIREYLAALRIALLPEDTRKMLDVSPLNTPFLPLAIPEKPSETRIEQAGDAITQLTLRIPQRILPPNINMKSSLQKDLFEFLSRFLGKRTVEISPTWIQMSTSYFGLKLGRTYHIPTASVRVSDVNWHVKKLSGGSESSLRRIVVGINHAGRTIDVGSQLTQEEAEWLVHEICQYISEVMHNPRLRDKKKAIWICAKSSLALLKYIPFLIISAYDHIIFRCWKRLLFFRKKLCTFSGR